MAYMSYCRFEGTVNELQGCIDDMDEKLSEREENFRKQLINMAIDIALDYGYIVNRNIEEVNK